MGLINKLILIDQATKVLSILYIKKQIVLWPGFLTLEVRKNTGISFSLFSDLEYGLLIKIALGLLLIILSIYLRIRYNKYNFTKKLGLAMIVAGGVSNLIDRFFYEGVIDMISIAFCNANLFVCNFADLLITLGFVWYITGYTKKSERRSSNQDSEIKGLIKEDSL